MDTSMNGGVKKTMEKLASDSFFSCRRTVVLQHQDVTSAM